MSPDSVVDKIKALAGPAMTAAGVELLDVELSGQDKRPVVRVTIDRPGGIDVEDCAAVSRHLGDLLDIEDVVEPAYILEVSSPGLDRPLKKPDDFRWAVGREVKISLRHPVDGRNVWRGRLTDFADQTLRLENDQGSFDLPYDEVAKARLEVGDPFKRAKK